MQKCSKPGSLQTPAYDVSRLQEAHAVAFSWLTENYFDAPVPMPAPQLRARTLMDEYANDVFVESKSHAPQLALLRSAGELALMGIGVYGHLGRCFFPSSERPFRAEALDFVARQFASGTLITNRYMATRPYFAGARTFPSFKAFKKIGLATPPKQELEQYLRAARTIIDEAACFFVSKVLVHADLTDERPLPSPYLEDEQLIPWRPDKQALAKWISERNLDIERNADRTVV